ncbi:MAG TPA: hypothetical protein VJC13_01715 [Candidatus Paceibacterota bacterium]
MDATDLIRPVNLFEQDFSRATEAEREQVVALLRVFMARLRIILRGCEPMVRKVTPQNEERCATCAFNPVTDSLPGFALTAYGVLQCIYNDQKAFLCHGENPDWEDQHLIDPANPILCNGFLAVRLYAGISAALLAIRTMKAIRKVVPKSP